ncbi:hypothetical protein FBU30_000260 [Linnemannia zychae]|nr:hypothetical protein FBU30_000260 [Linnemannia zychae]
MASQTTNCIREFLSSANQKFAVVGASTNRAKFGNKVLRWYKENGYPAVIAVNPKETTIESIPSVANLSSLPGKPSDYHVSIITPPAATQTVLEEAYKNGIRYVWMQPGAESPAALEYAREKDIQVIANGPCVLENGIPSSEL